MRDAARFRQLVDDALQSLPPVVGQPAAEATLRVLDVPDPGDLPLEPTRPDDVPLARFEDGAPPSLVVYRRALELRADGRADLQELVRTAVGMEVAAARGIPDEDWLGEDDDDW